MRYLAAIAVALATTMLVPGASAQMVSQYGVLVVPVQPAGNACYMSGEVHGCLQPAPVTSCPHGSGLEAEPTW